MSASGRSSDTNACSSKEEEIMAISTEIVGKTFGPFVRDYTFKDLEICALGCGCAWDGRVDLEYVNEHDAKNHHARLRL